MKKLSSVPFRYFMALLIALSVGFTSCNDDDDDDDPTESTAYVFGLNAFVEMNGEPVNVITMSEYINTVSLFIFDQDGLFVEKKELSSTALMSGDEIIIDKRDMTSAQVVAWGNIRGNLPSPAEAATSLNVGDKITDLYIQLSGRIGTQYAISNLFYGMNTFHFTDINSADIKTIDMACAVGTATAELLLPGHNAEDDYYIILNNLSSTLDYQGNPGGDKVSYMIDLDESLNIPSAVTPQYLFPSQGVTVGLYKNGELIYTQETDEEGFSYNIRKGENTHIVINLY